MNIKLINIVEALLFSAESPLSLKQIKDIINDEKVATGVSIDIKKVDDAIAAIKMKYENDEYSFQLLEIAGGYRFGTKKEYAPWLSKLNKEKLRRKLSQSALETLAIIAYKQPITKSEIEAIRGVNVDYIVGTLLEKNLVTIKGRADAPGRPILYGITNDFLEYIGLDSAEQLPPLKEIADIIKAGPTERISQSDLDFFEEINLMKNKLSNTDEETAVNDVSDNVTAENESSGIELSEDDHSPAVSNDDTETLED